MVDGRRLETRVKYNKTITMSLKLYL